MNNLLTTQEAAQLLGLQPTTLAFGRSRPIESPGLPFVRFSARCIRYRRENVERFIRERVVDAS